MQQETSSNCAGLDTPILTENVRLTSDVSCDITVDVSNTDKTESTDMAAERESTKTYTFSINQSINLATSQSIIRSLNQSINRLSVHSSMK
jgi:hypothetical protein